MLSEQRISGGSLYQVVHMSVWSGSIALDGCYSNRFTKLFAIRHAFSDHFLIQNFKYSACAVRLNRASSFLLRSLNHEFFSTCLDPLKPSITKERKKDRKKDAQQRKIERQRDRETEREHN